MGIQVYKDSNHKPEMALALSDFTALCGFVETGQLTEALDSTPELRGLVGEAMASLVASSGNTSLRSDPSATLPFPHVIRASRANALWPLQHPVFIKVRCNLFAQNEADHSSL